MNYQAIKLELFYLRKAFFQYHQGFEYLKSKYFLAPKILKFGGVLEKPVNQDDLSLHILSCHRDLVILIWSLFSFYQVSEFFGQLFIHNDGSLTNRDKAILKKFFPGAIIIEPAEALDCFDKKLADYPLIKKYRLEYPEFFLLKKLIDPYCVSQKPWRLIIDSDLLWFKNPDFIGREILGQNAPNSYMIKGEDFSRHPNYVYFKDGSKLEDNLANFNSGAVFYAKENFALDKLQEYFAKIDKDNKQNNHFIEQAGYAYCLKNLKPLTPDKYLISAKAGPDAVLRHYTSPKRPLFYLEGLKKIINKIKI
ncbi:MAG: hypothetical protein A3J65_04600 [Candidatus Buchananbacteria bacterium RIFCSPHIGHO2_02_FULL_45_11b]|uniref:Nucleotide-diphospho-sugar transferase domain-containing protein n=2 Tax=Candidatus Buchananiibacteriota TaxID=1817903 RepID=A0A1G1YDE9_9BACT|nr:MAG: hypothetical protein A3J65_04600 [Candidatus Buchananbacteria bacterium RIFCSPHIGHO2_02_FULL_45_11b]OGY58061.1 MAG: hypothetical protein A3H67_01175 [Candidatus Buchananbacteria bacterium RIFCSPLOWO2_02_FULL_46_11b]